MTPEELLKLLALDNDIEYMDGWDQRRFEADQGKPPMQGEALAQEAVRNARYFKENSAPQTVEELAVYWIMGYLACCVEAPQSRQEPTEQA